MTLLYDSAAGGAPGTHVLAIGVGKYPHLLGGKEKLANKALGLKQLQSPPVSVKGLLDWFIAPLITPGVTGFSNQNAPLASVEALASSPTTTNIVTPAGEKILDPATLSNIQVAFDAWLKRLRGNADNVGVFYFCGHGVMVSDHFLLAEDFGRSDNQPWENAFDITNTMRAIEREVSSALYFLIDACREVSKDVALTLGANPRPLLTANVTQKVSCSSLTAIYATGEGELAFAPTGGQMSRFTSAFLSALSGYCGVKVPGSAMWVVDGETLATATRQLLEFDSSVTKTKDEEKQVSEQLIRGRPVPFMRLSSAPKVKVSLNLSPEQRRVLYEMFLESVKGLRVAQTKEDQVFKVEVPPGFYTVGARDPAGVLQPVERIDEELSPPLYTYELQVQT